MPRDTRKERVKVYDTTTKRWIFETSDTFRKRKATGVDYSRAPRKLVKEFQPPKGIEVTKSFKDYPVDTKKVSWNVKKPDSVPERRAVLETCGPSCMLAPKELKFPICNKNPPPCVYNRKGINAAYVRSKQWDYEQVATAVQKLRKKLGLEKEKTKARKS